MYYYYNFIYDNLTVFITTLIVLAVISAIFKFKAGIYASITLIVVILLGVAVKEFIISFTYGLRSIFFQMNRYLAMFFNIIVTIVIFSVVVGLFSLLSRKSR